MIAARESASIIKREGRNGQKVQSTDCSGCTSLAGETLDKKSLLHNEGYASELTQDKNIEIGMSQL